MNRNALFTCTGLMIALVPAPASIAETPLGPGFSFQGRLFDGGLPAEGPHDMRFGLYDAETNGLQVGGYYEVSVEVDADGLFNVEVNSDGMFGASAFDGHERWLEVTIDDTTTLAPRQKLTAVPYATKAKAAFALDASDGSPMNAVVVDDDGNVGIGTTNPQERLHVNGDFRLGGTTTNFAFSGEDPSGMYFEQHGDSPARSKIRLQTSKSGDLANYAQFFVDPNDGFSFMSLGTGNGNVGIGLANPEATLDILGNQGASGDRNFRVTYPGGQLTGAELSGLTHLFGEGPGVPDDAWTGIYAKQGAASYAGVFNGNLSVVNGNVGIGTAAPAAKVHIATTNLAIPADVVDMDALAIEDTDATLGLLSDSAGGYGSAIALREIQSGNLVDTWGIVRRTSAASNPSLRFTHGDDQNPAANATLMSLSPTGNLGLGATTADARLTVHAPESLTQTDFTESVANAGILISTEFTHGAYTPGVFWRNLDTNPDLPIAGIYLQEKTDCEEGVGCFETTSMHFGTTRDLFDEGITNDAMVIDPSGWVGIGTDTPGEKLHVIGDIRATGSVFASCGTLTCSDRRFKTNVAPLEGALDTIEKLRPVRFDWKREDFPDHRFSAEPQVGLIAQEVQQVLPEVVQQGGDGFYSVDYSRLTPILVDAVKEVKCENDAQAAEQQQAIRELRTENAELRARLECIEAMLAASPVQRNGGEQ